MKMMKKITSHSALFLALSFGLSVIRPEIAQAGIVITCVGSMTTEEGISSAGEIVLGAGVFVLGMALIRWDAHTAINGLKILVLETDSSLNQLGLENSFNNLYPFINNSAAITNLARIVKQSAPDKIEKGQTYSVAISPGETRNALEGVDLTPEQIQKVVNDLK